MIILGVDPGYERVGVAVIEKDRKEKLLFSTCLMTSSKDTLEKRLYEIGEGVAHIIETYRPEFLATETLFFNTNQKTALKVAAARGVIIYEGVRAGLRINEYTPLQVKTAITGYGRADKRQMTLMVEKLIALPTKERLDDEFDAIAIALTHSASYRA